MAAASTARSTFETITSRIMPRNHAHCNRCLGSHWVLNPAAFGAILASRKGKQAIRPEVSGSQVERPVEKETSLETSTTISAAIKMPRVQPRSEAVCRPASSVFPAWDTDATGSCSSVLIGCCCVRVPPAFWRSYWVRVHGVRTLVMPAGTPRQWADDYDLEHRNLACQASPQEFRFGDDPIDLAPSERQGHRQDQHQQRQEAELEPQPKEQGGEEPGTLKGRSKGSGVFTLPGSQETKTPNPIKRH